MSLTQIENEPVERKEWVKLAHSPSGTTVSVTVQEGNQSVRWTVKTYSSAVGVKSGVKEARNGAVRALDQLQEALRALDEEQAS